MQFPKAKIVWLEDVLVQRLMIHSEQRNLHKLHCLQKKIEKARVVQNIAKIRPNKDLWEPGKSTLHTVISHLTTLTYSNLIHVHIFLVYVYITYYTFLFLILHLFLIT